jgi:hypothetical protein
MAEKFEKVSPADQGNKAPEQGNVDNLSEQDLGKVSGGFNPQPDPPRGNS